MGFEISGVNIKENRSLPVPVLDFAVKKLEACLDLHGDDELIRLQN